MATRLRPPPAARTSSIAILVPGDDAIATAGDPASVIRGWARGLGFDGLSTFFLPDPRAADDAAPVLWSTWAEGWLRNYRDEGYSGVDPRLVATAAHALPCLWDGGMIVGEGRLMRFLEDAGRAGIRSGVAIPIPAPIGRAVVAFDSSIAPVTRARRDAILERLGEMMWIARAIHASRHVAPPPRVARPAGPRGSLSVRERSCLALSAHGLTSRDIAVKLGIASRTVDFHIGNVLVKLAALNRQEAIAKAIAQGWLAR